MVKPVSSSNPWPLFWLSIQAKLALRACSPDGRSNQGSGGKLGSGRLGAGELAMLCRLWDNALCWGWRRGVERGMSEKSVLVVENDWSKSQDAEKSMFGEVDAGAARSLWRFCH